MERMTERDGMAPGTVPRLGRGVRLHRCRVRGAWFLLAPERAIRLDPTGIAVLELVDGARDLSAIAGALAERFEAPRARIEADAGAFLAGLAARGLVGLDP